MEAQTETPLPKPKIESVADAVAALPPDNAARLFACAMSGAVRRLVAQREARETAIRLAGLPAGERNELVGERVGRSARTIERWTRPPTSWRDEGEI